MCYIRDAVLLRVCVHAGRYAIKAGAVAQTSVWLKPREATVHATGEVLVATVMADEVLQVLSR